MNSKDYKKIAEIMKNWGEIVIEIKEESKRLMCKKILEKVSKDLAEYFEELEKKENDITGLGNLKIKEQFIKACGVDSE